MHATYYFLATIDLDTDVQDIYNAIESDFMDYAGDQCDENNWWSIHAAVLADDRVLLFADGSQPPIKTGAWTRAWRQAYKAVAYSMAFWLPGSSNLDHWAHKLDEAGLAGSDIGALIRNEMPRLLAAEYSALSSGQPSARQPLSSYQRAQTARAFELYLGSETDGNAPFSLQHAPPYDYRAFSLGADDEANAIIMVDIHT